MMVFLMKGMLRKLNTNTANSVIQASRLFAQALKKLYQPDCITRCQNRGIFSELSHFHMHAVPRYKHQSFADFYLDTYHNSHLQRRLAETKENLKETIKKIEKEDLWPNTL